MKAIQFPDLSDFAQSGVYFLHLAGSVVYVGQGRNMRTRIGQHLAEGFKRFDAVSCIPCSIARLDKLETFFIEALVPRYNACRTATAAKALSNAGCDSVKEKAPLLYVEEAAAFLHMSPDDLMQMEDRGPKFRTGRRPITRARTRVFPADEVLLFAAA